MQGRLTVQVSDGHDGCLRLAKRQLHGGLVTVGCVVADLRREVDEVCALLGCYAAYGGSLLPTVRFNLSVPSSGIDFLDPRRWDVSVVPKRR